MLAADPVEEGIVGEFLDSVVQSLENSDEVDWRQEPSLHRIGFRDIHSQVLCPLELRTDHGTKALPIRTRQGFVFDSEQLAPCRRKMRSLVDDLLECLSDWS